MGIRIFTGEDRGTISERIKRELGEDYEVYEGENLGSGDLSGIFLGETLFGGGAPRKILIKDLGENKEAFNEFSERIEEFLGTDAEVVIFETKVDKRLAATKKITRAGVEIVEFKKKESADFRAVFNIYDLALRDGTKAVKELEKIEAEQDPYMFFGLLVSQALKKLEWEPNGKKEKRALLELSKTDMLMKTTSVEPWVVVKSFLLRLSKI